MIRRPPRSTRVRSSAASDVYKRQVCRSRWQPEPRSQHATSPQHWETRGDGSNSPDTGTVLQLLQSLVLYCAQLQVFRLQLCPVRGPDRTEHPHEQVPPHTVLCCVMLCTVCGVGVATTWSRPAHWRRAPPGSAPLARLQRSQPRSADSHSFANIVTY